MNSPVEEVGWWSSEALRPYGRLLAALVGDVYMVRDMMARYAARGKTPPLGFAGSMPTTDTGSATARTGVRLHLAGFASTWGSMSRPCKAPICPDSSWR